MGAIAFEKQAAASVATPAAGKVSMFIDTANGEPKYKDDTGTVLPLVGGFGLVREVMSLGIVIPGGTGAATYAFIRANTTISIAALNLGHVTNFLFDPADLEIGGKKPKMKLSVACMTPDTASTITHTVGIYPVTGSSGATTNLQNTTGEVVSGSTVSFENQAAKTIATKSAKGFEMPSGLYVIGDVTSGTNGANCRTALIATLKAYWE